jgi:hypothetical protein
MFLNRWFISAIMTFSLSVLFVGLLPTPAFAIDEVGDTDTDVVSLNECKNSKACTGTANCSGDSKYCETTRGTMYSCDCDTNAGNCTCQ